MQRHIEKGVWVQGEVQDWGKRKMQATTFHLSFDHIFIPLFLHLGLNNVAGIQHIEDTRI